MSIFVSALKIYYYDKSLKNQNEPIIITANIFQSYTIITTKFSRNCQGKKYVKNQKKAATLQVINKSNRPTTGCRPIIRHFPSKAVSELIVNKGEWRKRLWKSSTTASGGGLF
jgi:hypothetical protein